MNAELFFKIRKLINFWVTRELNKKLKVRII